MKASEAAWYLAALIDGEGCVYHKGSARTVQITNCEIDILDAAERALTTLGIPFSPRNRMAPRGNRKVCYSIRVAGGRDTFRKIAELIPLQSARKVQALAGIVQSYKDKPARPTAEWLREHYVEKKWLMREIGAYWGGADTNTVKFWMVRAGIGRRNMSETATLRWKTRRSLAA